MKHSLASFLVYTAICLVLRPPRNTVLAIVPQVETVVRSTSACEVCQCVAGENPKDVVHCDGLIDVTVINLPNFVNTILVSNATGSVVFKRSSIRIGRAKRFKVSVSRVQTLTFEPKSLNILSGENAIQLTIDGVDEAHFLKEFVSAPATGGGSFSMATHKVNNLHLNDKAFDVLDNVTFADVKMLHLSPFALKPNHPPAVEFEQLEFEAAFERTRIKTLPTDTFPAAKTIRFDDCQIADIESNAFSGNRMHQIIFNRTSIDRLHYNSLPAKTVVHTVYFDSCKMASFSERSIMSGVSRLKMKDSIISSISQQAMDLFVAEILVLNNTFQTLSQRALIFKSWSNLTMANNTFKYVEGNAFEGISNDGEYNSDGKSAFTFTGNRVMAGNRNALRLRLSDTTAKVVRANVYEKDCHCSLLDELDMLTGNGEAEAASGVSLGNIIRNSSLCKVPSTASNCFVSRKFVLINQYYDRLCSRSGGGDEALNSEGVSSNVTCKTSELDHLWSVFQDKIEPHTNRGILLIVLLFVLASCLVVGIVTLVRWVVYSIQNRGKYGDGEDEWNFTKVEERLMAPSPIPLHMEDNSPGSGKCSRKMTSFQIFSLDRSRVCNL